MPLVILSASHVILSASHVILSASHVILSIAKDLLPPTATVWYTVKVTTSLVLSLTFMMAYA
jgi:hypothetical protein